MNKKKLVSMLTAGALATTMVMPAMAADGGSFDVDVTTKTGILRVEVPTTLAIAVDQFETSDAGSQIYSEEFTIANKSEVNVKVNVTSSATVGNGVTLAAKRADVDTATGTNGTAWMAVAASLDGTKYESANKLGDLNETNANVTTFGQDGKAAQTFYLKKGTGTGTYKMLAPAADADNNGVSYAQFYKLTALATQPTDTPGVVAEAAKYDLWVATAATDGTAVTKIEKGDTAATITTGATYYTAAEAATAKADLKAADKYVYGELAKDTSDADAAFRYVGALSSNKEVWDSTDISRINIAYTIQGLPQSTYDDAVSDGITYGLYKEKLAAGYVEADGVAYLSDGAGQGFDMAPSSIKVGGTALTSGDYVYDENGWISLKTKPNSGTTIEVVVNGTTYKVTTP